MKIDLCVCTHNPKPELFTLILTAIANQTLSKDIYQVLVIDNNSNPPILESNLRPLATAGITYQLLQEPRLGILYARALAGAVATGDAVLFVDDDNELMPDYLETAIDILASHPEIGFFGGKLRSGIAIDALWLKTLSGYLGIKDCGDLPISKCIVGDYEWGEWEPPTAGAVVRIEVLQQYFKTLKSIPSESIFGRQGSEGLLSSEDSLIAKCCYDLGLACAYQPRLQLIHHIDPIRLKFNYFVKLMFGYGRSYVLFRKAIDRDLDNNVIVSLLKGIKNLIVNRFPPQYLICLLAKEAGFIYESWRSLWPKVAIPNPDKST